ncbi:hypothetical protein [Roseibium sediminis]|uniref:hypothetical protein n=1 Tax=Roseibium sediminis TaxID=1775174 RepID=UPI00123DCCB2|nr:hypothetical protein [Roseibium sediminis]
MSAYVGSAKKTPKGRKKVRIGSFKVGKCFSTITLAFGGRGDAQFVYDRLGDFTYSNLQDAEVWFKYPTIKFRDDGQLIYFDTKKLGGMFGSGGMIGSMVMSHVPLPMSELGLGNGSSDLDGAAFQMPLFVSESLAWPEVLTGNRAKKRQKVPLVAAIYGSPEKSECPSDTQGPCQSLTMETKKIKKAALLSRLLKLGRSDLAATNLPLKEVRIIYDRLKRPVQLDMEDTTVLDLYYDRDRAKPIPPGGMSVLP